MDNLNILFIGNPGTGKTSLIDSTIKEYYKFDKIPKYNKNISSENYIQLL